MGIQHTMMERVHAGLPEESGWNKPELEPSVAIIAKRSGYCTMFAYVPLPTQFLIQLPRAESSNGESSLLAEGWITTVLAIFTMAEDGKTDMS